MAMKFNTTRALTAVGVGVADESVERFQRRVGQGEVGLPLPFGLTPQETLRYIAAIGGQFLGGEIGEDISISAIPLATKSLLRKTKALGASNWVPSAGPWARGVGADAGQYRKIS